MVVDQVVSAYGRIDILVNNAGEQYECTTVEDINEERLERVFRTNIFSYFFMVRYMIELSCSYCSTRSVNNIEQWSLQSLLAFCILQACFEAHERRECNNQYDFCERIQGQR